MTPTNLPDLSDDLQRRTTAEIRFDRITRLLYATDASNYQITPVGVVIPRTVEDLIAAVEICAGYKTPLLARGGGSSLAGQAVGEAVIVDTSKYLRQVIAVDAEAGEVRVQPGLTVEALNRRLQNQGLMIGPDPASSNRACLGGCLANNATGAHSILYGMFADQVLGMQAVLADGQVVQFGPGRGAGRAAQLWADVRRIVESNEEAIRTQWPGHWRRASGYNLNYMLPDAPGRHPGPLTGRARQPNLARLVCGSEGTLAVIAEATLNLVPRPRLTALGVLQFDDMIAAMEATNLVLELDPSAVEVLDRLLIELTRQQPQYARMLTFVEGTPEALLIVEFYGRSQAELEAKLDRLEQHLSRSRLRCQFSRALTPQAQADVWGVRKAGLGLLMSMRGDYKPISVIEDLSVPAAALPAFMADLLALVDSYDTRLGVYGHASAGCLHTRPLINLKSARGVEIMQGLSRAGADLVLKYGGVPSGEHSDGLQRSYLNRQLFGPTLYQAMQQVKTVFDPDNLLNPGKVVDHPDPTQNLRYGPAYQVAPLPTFLDWSHEGDLAGAIEMCNGSGVCRKLDAGVMCPSYMATQDEQDTTRARANIFRALLSGALPLDSLADQDVAAVFDLCIGCKACKSECPTSVDMARLKTEFKAHYLARTGYPLRSRLIANVPRLSKVAAAIPGGLRLANFMLDFPLTRPVMNRLGLAEARQFPKFASETFSAWFHRRPPNRAASQKILLFNDTWTEYNYPDIGRAAVKVLEAAGYQVVLETHRACCGRPWLTTGLVEPAKEMARRNVDLLTPYLEAGLPLIGLEPSCILSFRDEYPALVDPARRDAAHRLARACLTIDEFLYRLYVDRKPQPEDREPAETGDASNSPGSQNIDRGPETEDRRPAKAGEAPHSPTSNLPISNHQSPISPSPPPLLFHGHCHQKALSDIKKSIAVLEAVGYAVTEIPSGCCGMAGNFGYEAEHYDISRKIGQDRLIPTVEAHPGVPLVANGVSCREQIEHMTGRRPRHLVEYVAAAIET